MANLSTYFSTIGTINTLHLSRNTLRGTINHLLLLRYQVLIISLKLLRVSCHMGLLLGNFIKASLRGLDFLSVFLLIKSTALNLTFQVFILRLNITNNSEILEAAAQKEDHLQTTQDTLKLKKKGKNEKKSKYLA